MPIGRQGFVKPHRIEGSEVVEADLAHGAVRAELKEPWRSHGAPRFFICGFAGGLFLTGGVGHPEPVEMNGLRVDVIGVAVAAIVLVLLPVFVDWASVFAGLGGAAVGLVLGKVR